MKNSIITYRKFMFILHNLHNAKADRQLFGDTWLRLLRVKFFILVYPPKAFTLN